MKRVRLFVVAGAAGALTATLCGCGSGVSGSLGGTVTPNVIAGLKLATGLSLTARPVLLPPIETDANPFEGIARVAGLGTMSASPMAVSAAVGSTTASSMTSLKYFIQSIRLCQDLDISGTAYNNARGCIYLYKGPKDNSDLNFYNTFAITQALTDTDPTHFIDLMTADGQATLKKPLRVDSSMIGSYKYGMIDFFRPIKVTASFPFASGGGNFYSKTTTTVVSGGTDSGGRVVEAARVGDTTTAPAQETVYMLNNGGVWFPFQSPFEITQSDIDAQNSVSMDLVFNPADFGKASVAGGSCSGAEPSSSDGNLIPIYDKANCITIDMPYVRMNPVPRKTGQKTYKETYLVDWETSGTSKSKLRIELYYTDANKDNIMGIDAATVMDSSATTSSTNAVATTYMSQTGAIATSDATVTLLDYQKNTNLTGLVRRTSGNVSIKCSYAGGACSTVGSTIPKAYTYSGETLVSSD